MEKLGIQTWITIVGMTIAGLGSYFTATNTIDNVVQRVVILESAKPQVLAAEIKGMKEDIKEIKDDYGKLEAKIDRLIDITIASRSARR